MQLSPTQFTKHLASGLRSLYTLHGDETLLVQEALDAIRAQARTLGFTERLSHTVSGAHFDWSEVLAAAGSMSLFGDKQILEIRIPSGKPGKEGSTAIQQLAESAHGNQDLLTIFILPKLDKLSKSAAWFTALENLGNTLEIPAIDRRSLMPWLAERLLQAGLQVKSGEEGERSLRFFADRVEGNLLAAHQEVQKLSLLFPTVNGQNITLSLAQIEAAVFNVARYDVFKLSEAILAGNAPRTQRMLDGLQAEGEAEVLVHWAIQEDIRNLHRLRCLIDDGKPLPLALQEARIWGNKQRSYERVLPRLTQHDASVLLHAAHEVDGIVKGLKSPKWPNNPWLALHQLAGMVCKIAA